MKKASLGILLIMVLAFTSTASPAQCTLDPTWVKMLGRIEAYGEDVACGLLVARARIERWAGVRAFYVPGLNCSERRAPGEIPTGFTVSFHAVRLVETTAVKLDYEGKDFYVSGLWNVFNITFIYHGDHDFTLIFEPVVYPPGPGELNVTGDWTDFTLDILGNQLITGKVLFYAKVTLKPIPIGDVYGLGGTPDRRIDIWDLVHVAKAYGSKPGMLNYDFSVDFDLDFEKSDTIGVGLGELTTVAGNLGTEY